MGSTVDDVEARGGEDVGGLDAGKLSEVLVKGDTLEDTAATRGRQTSPG